jgi:nitrogen PTS system EIIA component
VRLNDLIALERIVPALRVSTKKQLLQELARRAGLTLGRHERDIADAILQRERLGSTALGNGIAVPHARLAGLDRVVGLFARLERPVEFDAPDEQPVDLVFLLLAPEGAGADHLTALARVSRLLRDPVMRGKLRGTDRSEALYALLTDRAESNEAA